MLPQAAAVHVQLLDGRRTRWPHLELTATDAVGAEVRVNRAQALTAARAVIRTHPDASWQRGHTFDLRTALLDGGAV
ncbi:MAG: transcriptional regulator [Streptomycetaceae bacterium]|nr:transcriptional regulator [Streptomycetaceae bacterium]